MSVVWAQGVNLDVLHGIVITSRNMMRQEFPGGVIGYYMEEKKAFLSEIICASWEHVWLKSQIHKGVDEMLQCTLHLGLALENPWTLFKIDNNIIERMSENITLKCAIE